MINFTLFFSIFSVVMTVGIGGLLVSLHLRLGHFKKAMKQMPLMEDKFTKVITEAKNEMKELEVFAKTSLPTLSIKVEDARKAIDEIDYMLTRTKKAMDIAEAVTKNMAPTVPSAPMQTTSSMILPEKVEAKVEKIENSAPVSAPIAPPAQPSKISPAPKTKPTLPLVDTGTAQTAYQASRNMQKPIAENKKDMPAYVSESISRKEMEKRNVQSSTEQSLRESLQAIIK